MEDRIKTLLDHWSEESLAECIADELKSGANFSVVLAKLRTAVQQVEGGAAVGCLLNCLLWCSQQDSQQQPPASSVVQHLLLEAMPANTAAACSTHDKQLSVQLFLQHCSSTGTGKLASKVASVFQLTRDDVDSEGWQTLTAAVPLLLQQPSTYKPAVFLMMQFEGLDEVVDRSEVLMQLVADGQDTLAQQWATSLGRDYQIAFVEACIALERLKPAARAVRQLGLAAEFPNVEAMYRQRSLTRLMNKRLWSVAQSYAGNDAALQTQLVRGMAEVGELVLAEEFRQQAGLPPETLTPPDPAELAAQEAARREAYLQLDLPAGAVLWVDDAESCARASQQLAGSSVIGLDVEWKPSHLAGVTSPAALLQVASHTCVVLFDLMQLCQHNPDALHACLQPLLSSGDVLKVGFEVAGDLGKLASSWPAVGAFRVVAGVLDLRPMWVAHGLADGRQGGSARTLSAVGLSTLCAALLGKPLDKSQQMSDWSARPLTERQQQYAALDAFVLPQLYDVLRDKLGEPAAQQLVLQHTKTFSRAESPTAPSQGGDEGQPTGEDQRPIQPAYAATEPSASTTAAATAAATAAVTSAGATGTGRAAIPSGAAAGSSGPSGSDLGVQGSSNAPVDSLSAGEKRVLATLQRHGLQDRYNRLHLLKPTGSPHTTAWDTAAAVGVPTSQVAKTMTLLVNQEPHLVVTRGDQRIDMHKLASVLAVKRRAITIAPEGRVLQLTGFASGVPPVGSDGGGWRVIVDKRLAAAAPSRPSPPAASQGPATTGPPAAVTSSAAATTTTAAAAEDTGGVSRPGSMGRGGLNIVAALSLEQAPNSNPQPPTNPRCTAGDAAGVAATSQHATTSSSDPHITQLLAVQCGPDGVLRLSFEELLLLAGAEAPADVADAVAEEGGVAVSTVTGAAGGSQLTPQGTQAAPKLLLDSMLGRLCRWLRALGVDTEFVEPCQQGQAEQHSTLIQHVQEAALLQGRLFITRDQKLAMRRDVGGSVYLLSSNDAAEQLAELSRHFGIKLDEGTLMSRCGACNAAAYKRITHQEAAAHVSDKLLELVEEFWQCGKCGKVVWMGPKSYAAIELLEGLFTDGKTRPTPLQSLKNRAS